MDVIQTGLLRSHLGALNVACQSIRVLLAFHLGKKDLENAKPRRMSVVLVVLAALLTFKSPVLSILLLLQGTTVERT